MDSIYYILAFLAIFFVAQVRHPLTLTLTPMTTTTITTTMPSCAPPI